MIQKTAITSKPMTYAKQPLTELNDRDYWKATVAAVDEVLEEHVRDYVTRTQELLSEWGEPADRTTISNVRQGRIKNRRIICRALFEVGQALKNQKTA